MSGKALKRNSYWLRERVKKQTNVKKSKFKELHAIEHLSKHKTKLENCSFVENCGKKAKQKKDVENAIKYSKTNKDLSYPSAFRNFLILCLKKMIKYVNRIKSIDFVLKK